MCMYIYVIVCIYISSRDSIFFCFHLKYTVNISSPSLIQTCLSEVFPILLMRVQRTTQHEVFILLETQSQRQNSQLTLQDSTLQSLITSPNVYLLQKHEAISSTYCSFNFPDTCFLQVGKTFTVKNTMNGISKSLTVQKLEIKVRFSFFGIQC